MRRGGCSLTPPAVHPGMTIWGVKGAKSYYFCDLERHAKIQNRRQTPSVRKVRGRKEKKKPQPKNYFNKLFFYQFKFCQNKKKIQKNDSKNLLVGLGRRSACAMSK